MLLLLLLLLLLLPKKLLLLLLLLELLLPLVLLLLGCKTASSVAPPPPARAAAPPARAAAPPAVPSSCHITAAPPGCMQPEKADRQLGETRVTMHSCWLLWRGSFSCSSLALPRAFWRWIYAGIARAGISYAGLESDGSCDYEVSHAMIW